MEYVKIILYIIGGLIVLGIVYAISTLFGGGSPIGDGIGGILGAGAKTLNEITANCAKQEPCDVFKDGKTCVATPGCYWSPAESSEESSSCVNVSGVATGEGGMFSPDCAVGVAFMGWMVSLVIFPIIGAILSTRNKRVKRAGELTGEGTRGALRRAWDASKRTGARAIKYMKERGQLTSEVKETERRIGNYSANSEATAIANEAVNGVSGWTAEQKQAAINDNLKQQAETDRMISELVEKRTKISENDSTKEKERKEREKRATENAKDAVERHVRLSINYDLLRETKYKPDKAVLQIIKQQLQNEIDDNKTRLFVANNPNVLYFFDM